MSQKQKLPAEEKITLIRRYLDGEISLAEASRQGHVDGETVRNWVRQYEIEGAAAFLPDRKNRVYTEEIKLAAVTTYLAGKGSLHDICKEYRISDKRVLREWIKVHCRQLKRSPSKQQKA